MNVQAAFQTYNSGIPTLKQGILDLIKSGGITIGKEQFAALKNEKLKKFIVEMNIPQIDKPVSAPRGGIVETATTIAGGDANHSLVKLASDYKKLGEKLNEALGQFKRELSAGYIRGEAKAEEAKATDKAAGAPKPPTPPAPKK